MTEVIYALCGVSLLQCVGLVVLLRRRRDLDLSQVDSRLAQFAEALSLLTDTTQSGFATVARELERDGTRRPKTVARGAAARRIASAVKKGRSIQDIASDEQVSESEVRLHLGLGDEPKAAPARSSASPKPPVAKPAPASSRPPVALPRAAASNVKGATATRPGAAAAIAVVHDAAAKAAVRRRGHLIDLGA